MSLVKASDEAPENLPTGRMWPGALMAGALTAAAAGTAYALIRRGLQPESQLFGPSIVAGHDFREIALTYDDGPNDRSTPELLELLDRFGVRATFFMVGKFIRQRPDLVRAVHGAGHLVGNHTMTHPFLANKPLQLIHRELSGCNQLLEDTLGEPIRYFRAPFGARRPAVLRIARELGLAPVQWNVQGNDWESIGVSGIMTHLERGLQRVQRRQRGANILLHDGFDQEMGYDRSDTVSATEILLQKAQAQAWKVVTVDVWNRNPL